MESYDWSPRRSQYEINKEAWQLLGSAFGPHEAGTFEYAFTLLDRGMKFSDPFDEGITVTEKGIEVAEFDFRPAPKYAMCVMCDERYAFKHGRCLACLGAESA